MPFTPCVALVLCDKVLRQPKRVHWYLVWKVHRQRKRDKVETQGAKRSSLRKFSTDLLKLGRVQDSENKVQVFTYRENWAVM